MKNERFISWRQMAKKKLKGKGGAGRGQGRKSKYDGGSFKRSFDLPKQHRKEVVDFIKEYLKQFEKKDK